MNPAAAQLVDQVRTQFDAAGIVFWVFDASGAIVAATHAGASLWNSQPLAEIARRATAQPAQLEPGFFACSMTLTEPCRGLTLVLAALSPEFAASPASAGTDGSPGVAGTTPRATFGPESARAILNMARSWVADACTLTDQSKTVEGFSSHLSQAFDNIDCLYAIGRAMHNPTKPREFLRFVCDRLKSSTDFGWVAVRFAGDDDDASTLADRFYLSGTPTVEVSEVVHASGRLVNPAAQGPATQILPSVPGLSDPENPQVLLQLIQHDKGTRGALIGGHKGGSDQDVSSWDIQLFEAAAGFITSYLDNVALFEEQRRLFLGTVQALTAAIDAKDRYTRGHSERVSHLSSLLAREIGLSEDEVERIRIAGLVHDVGKIGVPEAVLCKQGRLTDLEFDAIKRHPQIGYGILRDIPPLQDVLPGVLHHHERWDGRGYPSGLSNENIPLQARIIAVADTFDAMSSTRSYRPAMPRDKVLAEMRRCSGSQFDPALVPAFLRLNLSHYDLLVAKHAAGELPHITSQETAPPLAA